MNPGTPARRRGQRRTFGWLRSFSRKPATSTVCPNAYRHYARILGFLNHTSFDSPKSSMIFGSHSSTQLPRTPFVFIASSFEKHTFDHGKLKKDIVRDKTIAGLIKHLGEWYLMAEECLRSDRRA